MSVTADLEDEELLDDDFSDETEAEREARLTVEVELDPLSKEMVARIVDKMMIVVDEISGNPLRPYQIPFARRIIESLIINDSATITALFSRQCLDGDSVVFRRDGTVVRLRNHEDVIPTGIKPTKRYRFRGGSELVMTDNHPVLTPDGWIGAGLLRPGDMVSVAQEIAQWASVSKIERIIEVGRHKTPTHVIEAVDEQLGAFLGYFTTDGSLRPGQSPKFTNINPVYLDEVEKTTQERWGITAKRYAKGKGFDLLLTSSKSSYDNPLLDVLHAINWDHGFPLDVFGWSPEVVSEFVNRAWAGDGCISMKKSGPEIFLACGNDEIYARFWHSLLLKFGVMSTIKREQMLKGTGTFHRLVIGSGALNTKRFFQSFGVIYGKEKQSLAAIDFFALKTPLPTGKGRAERTMFKEHGWGPDTERLVWTRVLDITDAGVRDVYDIHVEDKGWFIANGVQVSNSGKSETVANVIAAVMIMFPILAKIYPDLLGDYSKGVWVGAFAPVEDQADTLFGRIVSRLTSEQALQFMADPEVGDTVAGGAKYLKLKHSGSICRKQTCHPRATIEGRTYHIILIDEAQGADEQMVEKSIMPMGTATNATVVFTGTPTYEKGIFYKQIQLNKRQATKSGQRTNHFEADYREVSKWSPNYRKYAKQQMLRMGEDSDQFKLSYRLIWLLDRGMFSTSEQLDALGDTTMKIVPSYFKLPVVVGIDPARKQDSTVVTVVWVNWDRPDEFGYFEHRILNWLDLTGMGWEEQYFRIMEFLANYNVMAVGVDVGGVGDVVASRLRVLMPHTEIVELGSQRPDQSARWKHLGELLNRGRIEWPAHSSVRRLRTYRRFRQQMEDLEKKFEGPYVLAAAPNESDAHDDYPDSLALACALTKDYTMPFVEVSSGDWLYK